MQNRAEKRRINKGMQRLGRPTMDAPSAFLDAFAMDIRDHDHFRSLLSRCEPQERQSMYDSLVYRIRRFKPLPLDNYIAQSADLAERKQLPTIGTDGKFHAYRPAEFKTLWSTVILLRSMTHERLMQTMRNLERDIPDEQRDQVIYKAHNVFRSEAWGKDEYLRISAGIYENGEAQRIQ
jgi:hypothetical protein